MKQVSRSGTNRANRLVRSPRKAKEWIDRAAIEIAASPADWKEIVDTIRADFGQDPLPNEILAPAAHQFVDARVSGRPAAYPISKLVPVAGGGMNAVLKSQELFAGRELAVRRHLPAESAVEVGARERREALMRERLVTLRRHPVIARFWTTGAVEGEPCDIFDFAPGVSLNGFVAKRGLTYGVLLDFAREAARGLEYLHKNGLIHGDVKPENFCVEERRRKDKTRSIQVTLIDFDIVSSPEEQIAQYALGNALEGTLPYMPPENFGQWVPENAAHARAMVFSKDIFALGMTLARTINGKFPRSFYTGINSLLEKKTRGEEAVFEFPDTIPPSLQILIQSMCATDWEARPSLATVFRTLRGLRDAATQEELDSVLQPPTDGAPESDGPSRAAALESVGPYRVVNRDFVKRPPGDGQELPIASLEDPFGRKLVGVPFEFKSRAEEEAFYTERNALLSDLNAVRLKHSDLLPGSFRDLVREEKDGRFLVWIIRPLLEGAIDLSKFLEEEYPDAPVRERVSILRRVAQALAVLEEAGYILPRLSPELVFFIPEPASHGGTANAFTRPLRRLFDVPSKRANRFFRQELMGTASARLGKAKSPDPIVDELLEIARSMRLVSDLRAEDRELLRQLRDAPSWRERVSLLVFLEMQLGGTRTTRAS